MMMIPPPSTRRLLNEQRGPISRSASSEGGGRPQSASGSERDVRFYREHGVHFGSKFSSSLRTEKVNYTTSYSMLVVVAGHRFRVLDREDSPWRPLWFRRR
jgi:hypothetical protein